jgi:quaternary ammonium compound-resistance protein SugE
MCMTPWILLLVAGLLEVVWATMLKQTAGFTKPLPSALTLAAMGASFFLLARAMQSLPAGTSYAVWVGIGAVGTVIAGAVLFGERVTIAQAACVALIVAGVLGLRVTVAPPPPSPGPAATPPPATPG